MPGFSTRRCAAIGWEELREDLKRRRAGGEAVGVGLAMFVEKSGLGPFDIVRASIDTSGTVEIVTGATSVGQGMETVIAQICADALGVDYRRVRVVHGQTDRIAYGMGTFASRVTVMTGEATRIAAAKLRAKAIAAAAGLLQTPGPNARRDRRHGGAEKRRSRTVDLARRRRARAQSRLEACRRSDAGACPPKACSSSST